MTVAATTTPSSEFLDSVAASLEHVNVARNSMDIVGYVATAVINAIDIAHCVFSPTRPTSVIRRDASGIVALADANQLVNPIKHFVAGDFLTVSLAKNCFYVSHLIVSIPSFVGWLKDINVTDLGLHASRLGERFSVLGRVVRLPLMTVCSLITLPFFAYSAIDAHCKLQVTQKNQTQLQDRRRDAVIACVALAAIATVSYICGPCLLGYVVIVMFVAYAIDASKNIYDVDKKISEARESQKKDLYVERTKSCYQLADSIGVVALSAIGLTVFATNPAVWVASIGLQVLKIAAAFHGVYNPGK